MNSNIDYYPYIRMSTETQAFKGTSEQRQRDMAIEYAEKNGLIYKVENEYKDIGVSGFTRANITEGQLGQFLNDVATGVIQRGSILAIENLDRLSRAEPLEVSMIIKQLTTSGIKIVSLDNGKEFTNDSQKELGGLFEQLIESYRAHKDSARKSESVSKGWGLARRKAQDTGRVLTKTCPAWLKVTEDRTFEVNKERASVVNEIFDWCIDGLGMTLICKKLNSSGYSTWNNGREWHISYVSKILHNKATIGEFQPKKRDGKKQVVAEGIGLLKNYFPQIVDTNKFYEAQAALESRKHKGGRKDKKFVNIFRGLTFCANCVTPLTTDESKKLEGKFEAFDWFNELTFDDQFEVFGRAAKKRTPMKYLNKGDTGGQYYVCNRAHRGLDCTPKGYPLKDFEITVLTHIKSFDYSSLINNEFTKIESDLKLTNSELESKKSQKKEVEDKLTKFKNRLMENVDNNDNSLCDSFKDQIKEKEKIINNFSSDIKRLETSKIKLTSEKQNKEDSFDSAKLLIKKMFTLNQASEGNELVELRTKVADRLNKIIDYIKINTEVLPVEPNKRKKGNREISVYYKDGSCMKIIPNPNDPTVFETKIHLSDGAVDAGLDLISFDKNLVNRLNIKNQ